MTRFLSSEWIEELARAADDVVPEACASEDATVLEHRVGDGPERVVYHVDVSRRGIAVRPGAAPAPTATLSCDRDTAAAIAQGRLSAQEAFMAGRLRIGGEILALTRIHGALAALPDVFAGVRDRTEF